MESGNAVRYQVRPADLPDVSELLRMQMALQAAMEGDGSRLLRINRTNAHKLRDYYHAEIQNEQASLLIAETIDPMRTVGMGTGKIWVHADYLPPLSGELVDLWVDPDHRRRGVAKQIIGQLLQFFRDRNAEFIAVSYVQTNEIGKRLWRKLGFGPTLVTATSSCARAQMALGTAPRPVVPLTGRHARVEPYADAYGCAASLG